MCVWEWEREKRVWVSVRVREKEKRAYKLHVLFHTQLSLKRSACKKATLAEYFFVGTLIVKSKITKTKFFAVFFSISLSEKKNNFFVTPLTCHPRPTAIDDDISVLKEKGNFEQQFLSSYFSCQFLLFATVSQTWRWQSTSELVIIILHLFYNLVFITCLLLTSHKRDRNTN